MLLMSKTYAARQSRHVRTATLHGHEHKAADRRLTSVLEAAKNRVQDERVR